MYKYNRHSDFLKGWIYVSLENITGLLTFSKTHLLNYSKTKELMLMK